MRKFASALILVAVVCAGASAQQMNQAFAALNLNGPGISAISQPVPITATTLTDSFDTMELFANPSTPVIIYYSASLTPTGAIANNAFTGFGFAFDLPDQGAPGYTDQEFVNGFTRPIVGASIVGAGGDLVWTLSLPACTTVAAVTTCIGAANFSIGAQGITTSPIFTPFGVSSTGAVRMSFTNGYKQFPPSGANAIAGDGFSFFDFLDGFTFNFYGTTYTRAYLTANAEVSFTTPSTAFPTPTLGGAMSGTPRIMVYYNDLIPENLAFSPRIYAQQFTDLSGVRKVKFGFERLVEFGNATGPHGGEAVITENGDISLFVAAYNAAPSIDTTIGITPGMNLDNVASQPSPFGRDLSADVSGGPTMLGVNKSAIEFFDYGNGTPAQNLMDLNGAFFLNFSDVGPGIVFRRNPLITPGAAYTIE